MGTAANVPDNIGYAQTGRQPMPTGLTFRLPFLIENFNNRSGKPCRFVDNQKLKFVSLFFSFGYQS